MKKSNSRLVYSTDAGRISPDRKNEDIRPKGDGNIYIRRETKGRKGKGVSIVEGLPLIDSELKALAKTLKQQCGTGGTAKQGLIEIQGDHRDTLKAALEKLGYKAKLAGG